MQIQLLTQSYSSFSKEDLEDMEGLYDEAVINKIYQLKGMALPEREPGLAEGITNFVNYVNDLTFEEPKPVQEVSLSSGSVDSYSENQLESAW